MKQTQMKQAEYMISLQMELVIKINTTFAILVKCYFILFHELQTIVYFFVLGFLAA